MQYSTLFNNNWNPHFKLFILFDHPTTYSYTYEEYVVTDLFVLTYEQCTRREDFLLPYATSCHKPTHNNAANS